MFLPVAVTAYRRVNSQVTFSKARADPNSLITVSMKRVLIQSALLLLLINK